MAGPMPVALAAALLAAPPPDAAEAARIDHHLRGAEARLVYGGNGLRPSQTAKRRWAIETLRIYRQAGHFPVNPGVPQTPIFVDGAGTHCALGALLEASGRSELVDRIRATANRHLVEELVQAEPALAAWLVEHGLTVAEAARIQPAYCAPRAATFCRYQHETAGLAEVEVMGKAEDGSAALLVASLLGETGPLAVGEVVTGHRRTQWPASGRWAVAVYEGRLSYIVGGASEFGIRSPYDPACEASPHLSLQEAFDALSGVRCIETLEGLDPRWAGPICDQGPTIDCRTGAVTYPETPWPEPPEAPSEESETIDAANRTGGCRGQPAGDPAGLPLALVVLFLVRAQRWLGRDYPPQAERRDRPTQTRTPRR